MTTTAPCAALRILIVDDEAIVRDSLGAWFRQDGHAVETAAGAKDALRLVAAGRYDIAFLDIKMPGMDGLELQARLAQADPELTIVLMTAYAAVDSAVQAMKAGAYDYIVKPFDPDDLSLLVKRAAEHRSLRAENQRLRESLESTGAASQLLGGSPAMRGVLELVQSVAQSDATVLITGESGTGKEVVARAIHAASARRLNPMVVVNCGALPEGILESELFGHEAGAFTGARARHKGKFEAAEGGTIFLDEIGEVSPKVQVELLRVLEDKVVTRLGGSSPVPVDFRTLCATNRDLSQAVAAGRFREDLYWRLNVVQVHIPPLRERPEDIPVLAEHFLARFALSMSRRPMRFSPEARDALAGYPWPGNVRELQNAIERAVVVGKGELVHAEDLPLRVTQLAAAGTAPGSLAEAERAHVLAMLEANGWNITRAARVLDVDRVTLYNKIQQVRVEAAGERDGARSPVTSVPARAAGDRPRRGGRAARVGRAAAIARGLSRTVELACHVGRRLELALPRIPGREQIDAFALLEALEARATADRLLVGVSRERYHDPRLHVRFRPRAARRPRVRRGAGSRGPALLRPRGRPGLRDERVSRRSATSSATCSRSTTVPTTAA